MLSLDDPEWADLTHAYGSASDIPDLLRLLAAKPGPKSDYRAEPWFTLWSSLCHQGDVYTASYAAVPHVVQIAIDTHGPVAFDFFQLPAAIEVARATGRGPPMPASLGTDYQQAIKRLPDCVSIHRGEEWDRDLTISAIAALAVGKGQLVLAEAIMNLDDDLIEKINAGDWE